jgi:hypothetical protein
MMPAMGAALGPAHYRPKGYRPRPAVLDGPAPRHNMTGMVIDGPAPVNLITSLAACCHPNLLSFNVLAGGPGSLAGRSPTIRGAHGYVGRRCLLG